MLTYRQLQKMFSFLKRGNKYVLMIKSHHFRSQLLKAIAEHNVLLHVCFIFGMIGTFYILSQKC